MDVHTSVHMLNTGVIVGLTQTIVRKIDMTRFVSSVGVNGGQLAESKNEKVIIQLLVIIKGRLSNDYVNTEDTFPFL